MSTVSTSAVLRNAREHAAAAVRLLDALLVEANADERTTEHFDPDQMPPRGTVRGNEGWNNLPGGTS